MLITRVLHVMSCCCYHKGTYFQANHNELTSLTDLEAVVVATTKVRIFKQITTKYNQEREEDKLLLLPQRYVFSSKSQLLVRILFLNWCCCCYHKGTYFQANHNGVRLNSIGRRVVVATTKVRIFKQITTLDRVSKLIFVLLLLPQRYVFSSKSQLDSIYIKIGMGCCCYHKGTYFQANHNR